MFYKNRVKTCFIEKNKFYKQNDKKNLIKKIININNLIKKTINIIY